MQPRLRINQASGLLAALLLSLLAFLCPQPITAGVLEIPGTGACQVLLRGVARAFNAKYPDHRVLVPDSAGSSGAIRAVRDDRAILGRVAQPLKGKEKTYGLKYLVFARDMVVFATGAKVTVKNLTIAQILDIFSGKITNWREVGGEPGLIRLLVRQPGDSSLRVIQEQLPAFRNIAFPVSAKSIHTDPKLLEAVQKYKHSLCWLTFSALKGARSPVYPLALDGVAPTPENARSHKYKLLEPYALIFKEERLNELARVFLDFIVSKECQKLMKQYGVIPVDKE
ncbi:MAG: substrate-binding domain-containing protein [Syntrophales bacterium]|nr:substrate-binding domain-containing protein [Syntrophales bacterium]MDD5640230.1 substrate-binding domain-containing protein [Syntrophales bacterium]